jgi:hypothetical protein
MRTREQLIHLRIIHVVAMLATALFIYQFSQWDDALWIPITVLAIIGPFSPGLSINKAQQRVLGSIAGLLLSLIFWLVIHYNYNLLVPLAVVLIYCVAYTLLQEYTFFIMLVTIMLCINFDYMNLFFNNEIFYLISRGLCVLTGVIICQFYEYCVFKSSYTNATSLVQKERLDALIVAAWQQVSSLASPGRPVVVAELNQCLTPLVNSLTGLQQLKESCQHSYSEQGETLILIEHYQEKLTSIYKWISLQGFNLLQSEPQQSISQVIELDEDSLEQKFSD